MNEDVFRKYRKLADLIRHPNTPKTEATAAKKILSSLEAKHPGLAEKYLAWEKAQTASQSFAGGPPPSDVVNDVFDQLLNMAKQWGFEQSVKVREAAFAEFRSALQQVEKDIDALLQEGIAERIKKMAFNNEPEEEGVALDVGKVSWASPGGKAAIEEAWPGLEDDGAVDYFEDEEAPELGTLVELNGLILPYGLIVAGSESSAVAKLIMQNIRALAEGAGDDEDEGEEE